MRTLSSTFLLAGLLFGSFAAVAPRAARAQTAADALFFSQRQPATGARLTALGGASIAGIGSYGSLYSNPAGLGYFDQSEVAGTFRTLLTTDEATYETFRADGTSLGRGLSSQSQTDYGLGNGSLVYKVPTSQGSFVFGVGLNETRSFGRELDFQNQNELSSVSDFFLPLNDEVSVQRFEPGSGPDELFFGQELVIAQDDAEYLVDFDPDGDGIINRPLSFAAFRTASSETLAIDFIPALFDAGVSGAEAFVPSMAPGPEAQFVQTGDISEDGALREVNLGSALEVSKGVMAGLSANISFGSYKLRSVFEEIDGGFNNGENTFPVDVVSDDGVTTFNIRTLPLERIRLTRSLDSEFSGFSLRSGLSAEVSPNVRFGVSIETPTWYNISENTSFVLATIFDDQSISTYGDDPGENAGRTTFDYEVRTPWRLGAGLSAQGGGVRLMVDAVFVDWTQLRLSDEDGRGTFDIENAIIEDTFDPVLNTRVGLEYTYQDLALRAGFAYQPSPVTYAELSQSRFGTGSGLNLRGMDEVNDPSRSIFSAGIGYALRSGLALDIAWAQERFHDRTLPYVAQNASFVNEEVVRNRVLLGLRYRF